MAVHLTRIYTRTGDDGTTGLADFSRVHKTDPRLVAYADCDETNAAIGLVLALGNPSPEIGAVLRRIQHDLFDTGADLATPVEPTELDDAPGATEQDGRPRRAAPLRVTADYVQRLETACDRFNEDLAPLRSFVLPGGTPAAALLHQARTVARRAERSVWALVATDGERTNHLTGHYLNRLSDLLFILARVANPGGDVLWVPGGPHRDELGA
ncbi:cob(I)yrinic acid a,c-diamide adenosyltransferase [Nakamurella leprariae]|uniref:Corrinoid adenosyltransferase n=1 Tax=Nakamurella leprariae TaxID=2803911 RepID=A0A939BUQ7_9ACTN|nr:cob(I)yrinic acid a,c-diamide adenosyltransferase [Nakamurella leprariae]MBM9465773.1 cob(I)yrinic acid a,c-diamide adenosyltransferase [Nakamurella leprariae]